MHSSFARARFVLCAKLFACHIRTSHTKGSLALKQCSRTSFRASLDFVFRSARVLLNASPYRTDFVLRSAPFRRLNAAVIGSTDFVFRSARVLLNASPYRTDFVFNLGKYISFFSKTYITIANVICNEVYQNV